MKDKLKHSLEQTKGEIEKIPEVLEKVTKIMIKQKEQNMKIQFLIFVQQRIFDFLASRNNGFHRERSMGMI